jgi:hypothetical protein
MSLENQREEYSVLENKGMYLIKYEKILGWVSRNCEELLKRKTMCNQTIRRMLHKYGFHI